VPLAQAWMVAKTGRSSIPVALIGGKTCGVIG
jgi:hypothetical protein